jgi:hypothetical protein
MRALSRVIFEAPDDIACLMVLCAGCLAEAAAKASERNVRFIVRDFGTGSGTCEFCRHEMLVDVGGF